VSFMQIESVWLYPRAAFHLGERGIGLEETALTLHSDTLFSALCAAWQTLYGDEALTRELLPSKDEEVEDWEPPFLLSSAFPFAGDVRFYPAPLGVIDEDRARDVEWVSEQIFAALLHGEHLQDSFQAQQMHEGTVWPSEAEAERIREAFSLRSFEGERFWAVAKVPRVALDVKTGASEIWHFGRVVFREGCGYHFLILYQEGRIRERLRAALHLLGDLGIGGDRTSGHGLFKPEFSAGPEWALPQSASTFVTLSLLYPKPEEVTPMLNEASRYQLITRSGWIGGIRGTPWRRKTVRMIAEGSRLAGDLIRLWGDLVDVTPEAASAPNLPHHVYRWGFAFPVAVEVRS